MKGNKYIFAFVFILLSASLISAATFEETYSKNQAIDQTSIQVEMLKYEPFPVNPGEYFDLWIIVQKTGSEVKGATFELVPEYPFSLDSNQEATKEFEGLLGESVLLEYKVRVNEDAVEGPNELKFRYKMEGSTSWIEKEFMITVGDAQTSFDGVIQEIDGNSISLAIANTGKNQANSVIVKVPKQDSFEAIGTSGQMVGNLEEGDYTLVSFDVKQIQKGEQTLTFQVDYTDSIDERRSVYLEIPLDMNSGKSIVPGEVPEGMRGKAPQQSNGVATWIYIVGAIVLIVLFIKRHRIAKLFRKDKK